MKKNFISVIIPVRNEENVISKTIRSVLQTNDSGYEIIIVNDGSTDRTKQIAEELVKKYSKRIKLLNYKEGHSAAFARNRGAEVAWGEYLIFLDADMLVNKNFIETIRENTPFDCLSFKVLTYRPQNFIQNAWAAYRTYLETNRNRAMIHVINKQLFYNVNCYNENIFYYEDADLKKRLLRAKPIYKKINFIVYHIDPDNFSDFIRQRKWQGKMAPLKYFLPCFLLPLILIQFFKISWGSKDIKNAFFWIFLDTLGRYVSLFERIKNLF